MLAEVQHPGVNVAARKMGKALEGQPQQVGPAAAARLKNRSILRQATGNPAAGDAYMTARRSVRHSFYMPWRRITLAAGFFKKTQGNGQGVPKGPPVAQVVHALLKKTLGNRCGNRNLYP